MSVEEKIKQIIDEIAFCGFQATYDEECERKFQCDDCPRNREMVDANIIKRRISTVLDGKVVVEREKLQELADLLKNRPKNPFIIGIPNDKINQYEEWFEGFEKKFELLFGETEK